MRRSVAETRKSRSRVLRARSAPVLAACYVCACGVRRVPIETLSRQVTDRFISTPLSDGECSELHSGDRPRFSARTDSVFPLAEKCGLSPVFTRSVYDAHHWQMDLYGVDGRRP